MAKKRNANSKINWLRGEKFPVFYTDSHGADLAAHRRAIDVVLKLAASEQHQSLIAVGIKDVIGPRSALEKVLPPSTAQVLSRGKVRLNDVDVYLLTKRIVPSEFGIGPALVPLH